MADLLVYTKYETPQLYAYPNEKLPEDDRFEEAFQKQRQKWEQFVKQCPPGILTLFQTVPEQQLLPGLPAPATLLRRTLCTGPEELVERQLSRIVWLLKELSQLLEFELPRAAETQLRVKMYDTIQQKVREELQR